MTNIVVEHNQAVTDLLVENPDLIKEKRWRMDNLYWIVNKDSMKTVFKMNRAQKDFFDILNRLNRE